MRKASLLERQMLLSRRNLVKWINLIENRCRIYIKLVNKILKSIFEDMWRHYREIPKKYLGQWDIWNSVMMSQVTIMLWLHNQPKFQRRSVTFKVIRKYKFIILNYKWWHQLIIERPKNIIIEFKGWPFCIFQTLQRDDCL